MTTCPGRRLWRRLFGEDEETRRWDALLAALDARVAKLERAITVKEQENDES